MAGRHVKKSPAAPKVIAAVIIAAVVIAAGTALFFVLGGNRGGDSSQPQTTAPSTRVQTQTQPQTDSEAQTQTQASAQDATAVQTTEQGVTRAQSEEPEVAVPTEAGVEATYFSATYIPSGDVIDTYTGESATLREVFGMSYSQGVITFNPDGSFADSVTSSDVNSGSYAVQDGKIIATYTNDKNMEITVTQWNSDAPSEFYINYGGYNVYFQ